MICEGPSELRTDVLFAQRDERGNRSGGREEVGVRWGRVKEGEGGGGERNRGVDVCVKQSVEVWMLRIPE